MSEQKLYEALSKALAEMGSVQKDSINPFFKSSYASLGAVIEAARPVLAKHGLAVIQLPVSNDDLTDAPMVGVRTIIVHEAGGRMEDVCTIPLTGQNLAQEAGKIITYLRRYALAAALGLYADEDTDGNTAQKPQERRPAPKQKKASPAPTNGGSVSLPQLLVDEGVAENVPHAAKVLNLMPPEVRKDENWALRWARAYRGSRDEGGKQEQAIDVANASVEAMPK